MTHSLIFQERKMAIYTAGAIQVSATGEKETSPNPAKNFEAETAEEALQALHKHLTSLGHNVSEEVVKKDGLNCLCYTLHGRTYYYFVKPVAQ
jgi:hypothetical protein